MRITKEEIMKKSAWIILAAALFLAGCFQILDGDDMVYKSYRQISQEEAREMMDRDDGHVVVDVRRQDEYDAGHIPGAILIPNESIDKEPPAELPDKDQIILIYCRTGNRSKLAAQKLFDMGYTNIYEFGGITNWTGEVVKEETEEAGGKTGAEESGEETGDETGAEDFDAEAEAMQPVPTLVIEANGRTFYADLEDNSSADALTEKLSRESLELDLHDYGSFEKVGSLPWTLPRNDISITTVPGDVILYQGNQITIYYDENTWEFTRLARIGNVTTEDLLSVFGTGNVTVKFRIEWSE